MSQSVEDFIQRWDHVGGSELANYQLFLTALTELLELPAPNPQTDDERDNEYVFEHRLTFVHGDGTESRGRIDLYRRGCFICEAKSTGLDEALHSFDVAMQRARQQAENYARALPSKEGRPPFLIVVDVGVAIELYSEFTRSGATYVPFPDSRSHRILLNDLNKEAVRERLRQVWLDPMSLDPSRHSARVTRDIASQLAQLAKSLEENHDPELVAAFLMRCLFTMFAEDVGLLPKDCFKILLEELSPDQFVPMTEALWRNMDVGGFSPILRKELLRFNGGLFADPRAVELNRDQIALLRKAAEADWRQVEPAIFGTLLERALNKEERHKLGAHYTPRAYVERLVMPTVIEPLRSDWQSIQAAAVQLEKDGSPNNARKAVEEFHTRLCGIKVLDPACGSANFLYVTLEHLKRLEGEVLNTLAEMQRGQQRIETEGYTVSPQQFLGLEVNPRAAKIAEIVLWIGYLQWHFKTYGNVAPPEPVLRDFHNIECRDAVLAWDNIGHEKDTHGNVVTRWDGKTTKIHPTTGKEIPDESVREPVELYVVPKKAVWPDADFVVGNPPYLGARTIRLALGHGYLDAIREVYSSLPEHADFVMYWWHHAAQLAATGKIRRFGLITTNSIRQSFSRKILDSHLFAKNPISILFAVPDHPWVDGADGAAVRVALTVGQAGAEVDGELLEVIGEDPGDHGERLVRFRHSIGLINPALRIGHGPSRCQVLQSNEGISCVGYQLTGKGFVINDLDRGKFLASSQPLIRRLISGSDITRVDRGRSAIDTYGFKSEELRTLYPDIYQHLVEHVKPERDHNNRESLRRNWWIYGEARSTFRPALNSVSEIIATSLTAKHRTFARFAASDICDSTTVMFAIDDSSALGVLSSRLHIAWALAAGSRLGVGNDPRYTKTRCFETFPFPQLTEEQRERIGQLGEQIDQHRAQCQARHPRLTITNMYNVLEKLHGRETLSESEKTTHKQGLVAILKELHDDLDDAVFNAYGWSDLADRLIGQPGATMALMDKQEDQIEAEEILISRLARLNADRAAEERRGTIRWMRPAYQNPTGETGFDRSEFEGTGTPTKTKLKKLPWPKTLPEQIQRLRQELANQESPVTAEQLARLFMRAQTRTVDQLLQTLMALGHARIDESSRYSAK